MLLKPSKFNYTLYNDSGELLVFNTYTGSMTKFCREEAPEIENLLRQREIEETGAEIVQLKDRGIFVDAVEIENLKTEGIHLSRQAVPALLLTILPTEQCNFRCVYCPEEFKRGKMSEATQASIIHYVRKSLHSFTNLRIMWFGGEPLLETEVIASLSMQLKEICKNAKKNYSAHVTTNGYILDEALFRKLLSYNIIEYQITLDGFQQSHDRQRILKDGSPTYHTIIQNLLSIKNNVSSGRFRINLRTNFTYEMLPDIPAYIEWYNHTFGSDPRFSLDLELAKDFGGERISHMDGRLIDDAQMHESFFDILMNCNLEHVNLYNYLSFAQKGGLACYAGMQNSLIIDAAGNIRKCGCHLEDGAINTVGTICDATQPMPSYQSMLWSVRTPKQKCAECFFSPLCLSHSCPYQILKTGSPPCPEQKIMLRHYLKLFDKCGLFYTI